MTSHKNSNTFFKTSPSYLSSFTSILLSKNASVVPKYKTLNQEGIIDFDSLSHRNQIQLLNEFNDSQYDNVRLKQDQLSEDYTCHMEYQNNLNTFYIKPKQDSFDAEYEIYFPGANQDAISPYSFIYRCYNITGHPSFSSKNRIFVFWNYPGVGENPGDWSSISDLIEAGYQQVKYLIETKKIPIEKIILHGKSLGGGIALAVAKRLYEEGYFVRIELDRSFANFSGVISDIALRELKQLISRYAPSQQKNWIYFTTSITLCAGILSSLLGVLIAGWIANINHTLLTMLGSILGGCLALIGALIGTLAGLMCALILAPFISSEQIDKMIELTIWSLLNASCSDINSIAEANELLARAEKELGNQITKPLISFVNAQNDPIIRPPHSFFNQFDKKKYERLISYQQYNYGQHIAPLM